MTVRGFPVKERLRFRKLLEVAHSTSYSGEREAALGAATRLAATHGMTLREAAVAGEGSPEGRSKRQRRRAHGFPADFGAAGPEVMGTWWVPRSATAGAGKFSDEALAADKKRRADALADAIRRGLDADERAKAERRKPAHGQPASRVRRSNAWRPRPEFIRVLLSETGMTAKEIATVAGVTIYDVFREKLLMRRTSAAG